MKKQRIWELDALRGLFLLCMIVIHFVFDLNEFAGLSIQPPGWFNFLQKYGHILFISLPDQIRHGLQPVHGPHLFHRSEP